MKRNATGKREARRHDDARTHEPTEGQKRYAADRAAAARQLAASRECRGATVGCHDEHCTKPLAHVTPATPDAPKPRTLADVEGEQAAVLHVIGVKEFQRATLVGEISGLVNRVRVLNEEAAIIRAAAKAAT